MTDRNIQLKGRLFLKFDLMAVTGLHIGGAYEGVAIGGVDKTVIRDPLTNQPYIPGSSLRGKTRSLVEKYLGKKQNQRINLGYIHSCDEAGEYQTCEVCQVFGVPGEREFGTPARLVLRDMQMDPVVAEQLKELHTDLPFTEVKVEVAIDRVTSQANPRQIERVPAGTKFVEGEMVYSLYSGEFDYKVKDKVQSSTLNPLEDLSRFATVLVGLNLLEDDYLGGAGARGSGKVQLANLRLRFKNGEYQESQLGQYDSLADLRADWKNIEPKVRAQVK